jgi:ABC-type nickel/cobalt efflux system permease component RcnA
LYAPSLVTVLVDNLGLYLAVFGLGCLHALEPGHGKALIVAYFAAKGGGQSKQVWQLAFWVSFVHALAMLVLAALFWGLSSLVAPAQLQALMLPFRWVLVALVLGLGAWVLLKPPSAYCHKDHSHAATGDSLTHHHEPHHHHPMLDQAIAEMKPPIPMGQVVMLAVLTGLTPCSLSLSIAVTALAVGTFQLKFWMLPVLLCFSLGLGAVVLGVGLATVYAEKLLGNWFAKTTEKWRLNWNFTWPGVMNLLSGLFILGLGFWLAWQTYNLSFMGGHLEPTPTSHSEFKQFEQLLKGKG